MYKPSELSHCSTPSSSPWHATCKNGLVRAKASTISLFTLPVTPSHLSLGKYGFFNQRNESCVMPPQLNRSNNRKLFPCHLSSSTCIEANAMIEVSPMSGHCRILSSKTGIRLFASNRTPLSERLGRFDRSNSCNSVIEQPSKRADIHLSVSFLHPLTDNETNDCITVGLKNDNPTSEISEPSNSKAFNLVRVLMARRDSSPRFLQHLKSRTLRCLLHAKLATAWLVKRLHHLKLTCNKESEVAEIS
ncbi:hypothetical protein PanWU01x14_350850 [Parasponia andersonii]|uniref:Uncharacterized protein n=1 Tax=Parasponia andersonii TaxID=3476 RepID=A0A2P5AAT3_PARAD|nr:hypothetical protein PanWU01x14_350850 [Parasponia andersonii]